MSSMGQIILAAVTGEGQDSSLIQRWDLQTGISTASSFKELYSTNPCGVSLLPESTSLLTSGFVALNNKTASLNYFTLAKEKPVFRFYGQDKLCSIAVSPDGVYLAGGNEDGKIFLWDILSGEMVACIFEAHFQRTSILKWSFDGGNLVSASADGTVKLWSLPALLADSGASSKPIIQLSDANGIITDVNIGFGIGSNYRLLTASLDCKVRLYDIVDGQLLATFEIPSPVNCVLMNSLETLIMAACEDGNVYLLDLSDDQKNELVYDASSSSRSILSNHKTPVNALSFSLDEEILVSGDNSGNIVIWNLASRQMIRKIVAEGSVSWITIINRQSVENCVEKKMTILAGQPKRAVSQDTPLYSFVQNVENKVVSQDAVIQEDNSVVELKAAYTKLVDHLLATSNK